MFCAFLKLKCILHLMEKRAVKIESLNLISSHWLFFYVDLQPKNCSWAGASKSKLANVSE